MKRSNSLREIIWNKKRVKKNEQNQPIFNTPVGTLLRPSLGYSYSTPSGLGPSPAFPQVAPGAIISLRSLLRFVFNPFGVGAFSGLSPGFS